MTRGTFALANLVGWGLVLFPEPATTATGLLILATAYGVEATGGKR